jgi:hypothetical protein
LTLERVQLTKWIASYQCHGSSLLRKIVSRFYVGGVQYGTACMFIL